jgi:hypothetical protein
VSVISRTILVVALATVGYTFAEEKLYRVNSKDVGWDSIDLTSSEVRREGQVSVLRIPRYEKRTSVESRFAMCAFTDIAIQREFDMWIVSDGSINDIVRVGFLKSESEDAGKVLGKEFVGENVLRGPVRVMNRMCGIERRK